MAPSPQKNPGKYEKPQLQPSTAGDEDKYVVDDAAKMARRS
jgi:hypothetical protein